MCNGTWACFNCRVGVRRPLARPCRSPIGVQGLAEVPCPRCGRACEFLGTAIELPRKRDARAWRRLRGRVERLRVESQVERRAADVRYRHLLERRVREQVRELESRPPNGGRARMVGRLKQFLTGA